MTDLLIRDVDPEAVRNIEANADRLGLSRHEYLRREVIRLSQHGQRPATRDDLTRSLATMADLGDDSIMKSAWE